MIKQFISELEMALVMIDKVMELDPELDREELERETLAVMCEEKSVELSEDIDSATLFNYIKVV